MSDIFISYAHEDLRVAEALADELKAHGYRVWWDAELLGSDDYYEAILQALNNAKAAIVIWTKSSARSRFVRDEARFALHLEKLIAIKDKNLNLIEIPFGFQSQHTDNIDDRAQIIKAIEKLGAKPNIAKPKTPSRPGKLDWVKSAGIDDLVAFLGTSPAETERLVAAERLKQLAASRSNPFFQALRLTNVQAFVSGLTLRMPAFSFSSSSPWSALGMAISYCFLTVLFFGLGAQAQNNSSLLFIILAASLALAIYGWVIFHRFVKQKLIAASVIIGISASIAVLIVLALIDLKLQLRDTAQALFIWMIPFLSLIYITWKIRSAR